MIKLKCGGADRIVASSHACNAPFNTSKEGLDPLELQSSTIWVSHSRITFAVCTTVQTEMVMGWCRVAHRVMTVKALVIQ